MAKTQVEVGRFKFERSTKNTHVFFRDVNGRREPQYVQKITFPGTKVPDEIRVLIEFED